MKMTKYKLIDLFSGCGGFSQGFLKAGYQVIAANDFWEPAALTYEFNHQGTKMIVGDISLEETKKKLYNAVKGEHINVIIGGPPCQGYSAAGNRNPDDPRGQLYIDFLEVVDHLKPDMFVMENVKGLLNMEHAKPNLSQSELDDFKLNCEKLQRYKDLKRYGAQRDLTSGEDKEFKALKSNLKTIKKDIKKDLIPLQDKIKSRINDIGYKVSLRVLNSADYGVAQTRERVIFIGSKHPEVPLKFPKKTHQEATTQTSLGQFTNPGSSLKNWVTSEEVLKRFEDWPEFEDKNHLFTKHSKNFVQRLKDTPIGGNVYQNYSDAWWRLDPERPARTVKENHGGVFVHYKFDRVCTPRELAALQSFDDDFIFRGTKSAVLKQIGNAVPPQMAKAIAEEVKKALDQINSN
jgi:DNA (cytosine-5)-methyltransferase 1